MTTQIAIYVILLTYSQLRIRGHCTVADDSSGAVLYANNVLWDQEYQVSSRRQHNKDATAYSSLPLV